MNPRQIDQIREEPLQLMMSNQEVIQLAYAHMEHIKPLIESRQKLTVDAARCYTAAFYTIDRQLKCVDHDYLAAHKPVYHFYSGMVENENDRLVWRFDAEHSDDDMPELTEAENMAAIDQVFEPAKKQNEIITHWQLVIGRLMSNFSAKLQDIESVFEKQRIGVCDGDGTWHGSDAYGYMLDEAIPDLEAEFEAMYRELRHAQTRLQECHGIVSGRIAAKDDSPF